MYKIPILFRNYEFLVLTNLHNMVYNKIKVINFLMNCDFNMKVILLYIS